MKLRRYRICKIIGALLKISDDTSAWNCTTAHRAHSLVVNVQNTFTGLSQQMLNYAGTYSKI